MAQHVPAGLAPGSALVVALHGCTQDASSFATGSGWSSLADQHGFAVLYPEQRSGNNANRCFNWFEPADMARNHGEAASVRQMVGWMVDQHGLDPARVYVAGLSAGGAMAAVLLATYPEVFAGGAIIAGLPYGCAIGMQQAFDCMFHGPSRPAPEWGDLVRAASDHRGPWPTVAIWHGGADTTVMPGNAVELLKQWTNVHGLSMAAAETAKVDGVPHRTWRDQAGRAVVESFIIPSLGHGAPLGLFGSGAWPCGVPGPYMLDAGICSTGRIAAAWGLTQP